MEASKSTKRWTYEEYARLPMSGTTRYEVIAGEVAVTPSPTSSHQLVVTELVARLHAFVRASRIGKVMSGPVDVLFAEGDYLQPDLIVILQEHLSYLTKRGIEGPPDLVVEVLSTSTARRDRGIKRERYTLYGVPEYWIIDIEARTLEVWKGGGLATYASTDEYVWSPTADASLRVPLAEVFDGLPD